MKKKASLLISGITTVALLATAVGSFAAWETLTDSDSTLEVATSTPVVLDVTGSTDGKDTKLLVPTGMTITDTNTEATEVKVGTVKVELKGTDTNKTVSSITNETAVYDETARTTRNSNYKVVLKVNDQEKTTIAVDDVKKDGGETYDVYLKFADGINNGSAPTEEIGKTKYVKIDLTAVK